MKKREKRRGGEIMWVLWEVKEERGAERSFIACTTHEEEAGISHMHNA